MRFGVAMLALIGVVLAHDAPKAAKTITVSGPVVDTGCYLSHDTLSTTGHLACATACAKAGVPLAIVDEKTGTVYLPVAADHKNQNTRLLPFVEKKVKVTGTLVEKGGIKGIILKTVEAAE